jgi:hypothetical protein
MTDGTLHSVLASHQLLGGPQSQMSVTLWIWDPLFLLSLNVHIYYGQWTIRFGSRSLCFGLWPQDFVFWTYKDLDAWTLCFLIPLWVDASH